MSEAPATTDVADEHGDAALVCQAPLRLLGGVRRFGGIVATVRCHEDNVLLERRLGEDGAGRVLVVDGGGSLRVALLGDRIAGLAQANGWDGLVIWGAVRDSATLAALPIGIAAAGTVPRRSGKAGTGAADVAVRFGGVTFRPGDRVYVDDDGVVVVPS